MEVDGNILLKVTGASEADIRRGREAAQALFNAIGVSVYDAHWAATVQQTDSPEAQPIDNPDRQRKRAEAWREAEREAIAACIAGRDGVYVAEGDGLSLDSGPTPWCYENPVAFGVNVDGAEGLTDEQQMNIDRRFHETLLKEFGNNNGVVAMYQDATDPERPEYKPDPEQAKRRQEQIAQARADGDDNLANDIERYARRRIRVPHELAAELWKIAIIKAEAAAQVDLPASLGLQFEVYTYWTE